MGKPIIDDELWTLIEPLLSPPSRGARRTRAACLFRIAPRSLVSCSFSRPGCVGATCLPRLGAARA